MCIEKNIMFVIGILGSSLLDFYYANMKYKSFEMGRKYYRKIALEQNRRAKNQQLKLREQQVYRATELRNKFFDSDFCVFYNVVVALNAVRIYSPLSCWACGEVHRKSVESIRRRYTEAVYSNPIYWP